MTGIGKTGVTMADPGEVKLRVWSRGTMSCCYLHNGAGRWKLVYVEIYDET